jgi:hypothetical protein
MVNKQVQHSLDGNGSRVAHSSLVPACDVQAATQRAVAAAAVGAVLLPQCQLWLHVPCGLPHLTLQAAACSCSLTQTNTVTTTVLLSTAPQ